MKNKILLEKLTTAIYYIAIFLFLIAFNFQDTPPPSGWYQQFLPNLNGRSITDVFFLDSLTGWSVTNATNQVTDSTFVLKTTNCGDNWFIQYRKIQTGGGFPGFFRVCFLNQNTGFVCGVTGIDKSTNGGTNWVSLNAPQSSYLDMSILNKDTIWIVSSESLAGGVFRTTNGGLNWTQQFSGANENPNKIYMFNARIGFISKTTSGSSIRKTTDGGNNWTAISQNSSFYDIFFIDSLLGYRTWDSIYKTTNGGLNWINQTYPQPFGSYGGIRKLSVINKDTIWGSYPNITYPNTQTRGMLYRTTNSGNNWYYQIPDTSFRLSRFPFIQFINKNTGWAYAGPIHTTTGGDTTFFSGIQQISSEVPKSYELKQNYPNPFNPRTVIPYSLKKSGYVKLFAYDITGKEIEKMVDGYQQAGEYNVDFMGKFTPSGVYFYRMEVTDERTNQLFSETRKMILIK